jgi:hypothetical protein
MPQQQRNIPLYLLNGELRAAIATGNNAAWLCCCERPVPLIGCSGSVKGVSEKTRVQCPDCGRSYFVVPAAHDRDRSIEVKEVAKPDVPRK